MNNIEHLQVFILKTNQKSQEIQTNNMKKPSIDIVYLHSKIMTIL